jgi:hypothetical protein
MYFAASLAVPVSTCCTSQHLLSSVTVITVTVLINCKFSSSAIALAALSLVLSQLTQPQAQLLTRGVPHFF